MQKTHEMCALCGKELKGLKNVIKYNFLGKDLCGECYGYAVLFCKEPGDLERYSIDDLKVLYHRDTCDLCGGSITGKPPAAHKKFVRDGVICKKCEKLLRPSYPVDPDDKKDAAISNVISSLFAVITDTAGNMNTYAADDPMESAGIEDLKIKYRKLQKGRSNS